MKNLLQGDNRRIKSESQGECIDLFRRAHPPNMDSSAIAVLVELLRRMGGSGRIYLTNLQPPEAPLELWRMAKEV